MHFWQRIIKSFPRDEKDTMKKEQVERRGPMKNLKSDHTSEKY